MKKFTVLAISALMMLALPAGALAQPGPGAGPANITTVTLSEQNGSGQSGTATIEEVNGQVRVVVNISGGSDTPQPAHIHPGTCEKLNPQPAFPLTSVVNGKSETMVPTTMANLSDGQFAINIHKSAAEVTTYVSCGNIVNMMLGGGAGGGTTGGGTTGGGTTTESPGVVYGGDVPGMPRTGSGEMTFLLAALVIVALSLTGVGFTLARRKV